MLLILSLIGVVIWTMFAGSALADAPNVVYVLADDFGYGDAGCYNPDSKIPTPNIDRLATEGMRFTDAHSGSSVCSPTRYGILTGRYAWRTKLRKGVLGPYDPPAIAPYRLTVPMLFKQKGYSTACIGKWHLGWNWPRVNGNVVFDKPIKGGPTSRGFDSYFGTDVPNYPPYCFLENTRTVGLPTAEKTVEDLDGRLGPMLPGWEFSEILRTITATATGYVAERAMDKKPFFLYFALTSPHEPVAPSAKFKGKSGISDLADFMMETDWAVGEVMTALEKDNLAANTLVIFTADNGHATYTGLPALKNAGHSVSGPFQGYKTSIYEGGHRVPFIVRWPATIKAGTTCDETICLTDLFATTAAILGIRVNENAGEDSVNLLPLLTGAKHDQPLREAIVHQALDGTLAIRQGKWKLIFGSSLDNALYDLSLDVSEKMNVAIDHPDVVLQLTNQMERIISDGRSTPGRKQFNDVKTPLRVKQ